MGWVTSGPLREYGGSKSMDGGERSAVGLNFIGKACAPGKTLKALTEIQEMSWHTCIGRSRKNIVHRKILKGSKLHHVSWDHDRNYEAKERPAVL